MDLMLEDFFYDKTSHATQEKILSPVKENKQSQRGFVPRIGVVTPSLQKDSRLCRYPRGQSSKLSNFRNSYSAEFSEPNNKCITENISHANYSQASILPIKAKSEIFSMTKNIENISRPDQLFTPTISLAAATPRGSSREEVLKLKQVAEIPKPYDSVFSFPYFNAAQSKIYDDVMYSDRPLVLCAPTGSGKTVAFDLAIIRLILQQHGSITSACKIVYMAPIKALCSERYEDWMKRFGPLGLKCMILTGDSEIDDYFELQENHLILTTPEKWDSMTRRWRDNKSLLQLVKLFLIDEVHTVNDNTRGATMEAVVSRMKTVQVLLKKNEESQSAKSSMCFRFIAVSATIPNVEDVGDWLSIKGIDAVAVNIDESHRPVRLRKVVLGFPCCDSTSEFRFDLSLNYKLAGVIETYAERKPTLVFCATRKGTEQAACTLVKDARFILNTPHKQKLNKSANSLKDSKLRDLVMAGVGYHHAGMDTHDRKTLETIFGHGDLPVLVCTSTLAMGVNLPAHLVVVKSTQHYVMGVYQEYSETQLLQMIGRAGRPQFDTTATAVIMTRSLTKHRYESLLNGTQVIESSLHNHLAEHLNAEVVLETITNVSAALEWLRSTFLYIRVTKNPKHYSLPDSMECNNVDQKLQEMCLKDLNSLADYGLVSLDADCYSLKTTECGKLMARYCIAFETMKNFHKIGGEESIQELLEILCRSREFSDIQLRTNEKKSLNTLNKDKNRITVRFPMAGKIKSTDMKVNCLIQAQLGNLSVQEFALQQDSTKIFRASVRVVRCLVEVLWQCTSQFHALLHAIYLSKCFKAKIWENSRHVAKQLNGIGPALSNALVNAGIVTFEKIETTNPRELELIVNRHPPFGNQIKDSIARLPKYDITIDQSNNYTDSMAELTITVDMINKNTVIHNPTAEKTHTTNLLIGDMDNNIVLKVRIGDSQLYQHDPWKRKVDVKRALKGDEISVHLVSRDWVGLDIYRSYTPLYTGAQKATASPGKGNSCYHSNTNSTGMLATTTDLTSPNHKIHTNDNATPTCAIRKPCSHKCLSKTTCAHTCCKTGVTVRNKSMVVDVHREEIHSKLQNKPPHVGLHFHKRQDQFGYNPSWRGSALAHNSTSVPQQAEIKSASQWLELDMFQESHQDIQWENDKDAAIYEEISPAKSPMHSCYTEETIEEVPSDCSLKLFNNPSSNVYNPARSFNQVMFDQPQHAHHQLQASMINSSPAGQHLKSCGSAITNNFNNKRRYDESIYSQLIPDVSILTKKRLIEPPSSNYKANECKDGRQVNAIDRRSLSNAPSDDLSLSLSSRSSFGSKFVSRSNEAISSKDRCPDIFKTHVGTLRNLSVRDNKRGLLESEVSSEKSSNAPVETKTEHLGNIFDGIF